MRSIEPEMVMGKEAVDDAGTSLGEIVDVGLYDHSRVKFLVLKDRARVGVDRIHDVDAETVRLRVE